MKSIADLRQSKTYAEFMQKNGWKVVPYSNSFSQKKQYIFIWELKRINFAIIRLHRVIHPLPLDFIEKISKKYAGAHIRIEANISNTSVARQTEKQLLAYEYSPSDWSHFPTKTRLIDLRLSKKALLSGMNSKTRYNVRLAQRRGVKIVFYQGNKLFAQPNILKEFYTILTKTEKGRGLPAYPFDWLKSLLSVFGEKAFLSLAFLEERPIAGSLFFTDGKTLHYTLNGSLAIGRKNQAPSYLIWETIQRAKNLKISLFDFDGIYDERLSEATYDWLGFSKFKNSFGGKNVLFMLPYEKTYHKHGSYKRNRLSRIAAPEYLPSLYPEPWVKKTFIEKLLSMIF